MSRQDVATLVFVVMMLLVLSPLTPVGLAAQHVKDQQRQQVQGWFR